MQRRLAAYCQLTYWLHQVTMRTQTQLHHATG